MVKMLEYEREFICEECKHVFSVQVGGQRCCILLFDPNEYSAPLCSGNMVAHSLDSTLSRPTLSSFTSYQNRQRAQTRAFRAATLAKAASSHASTTLQPRPRSEDAQLSYKKSAPPRLK